MRTRSFRLAITALSVYFLAQPSAWALKVWLPEAVSSYAATVDRLFYAVLWITGIAFILVQATLVVFLFRYRRREGKAATYTHGNTAAEVAWTVIPALILVWLAVYNQSAWSSIHRMPDSFDLEVEILAEQFAWNIRYPGPDGNFNTADDIVTINQLHLPLDHVVLMHMRSKDVIHSFFVPQFRVKRDVVPGLTSRMWVQATKTGNYEIACAELCGLGHYRMKGFLTVEPEQEFQQWLAETFEEQES